MHKQTTCQKLSNQFIIATYGDPSLVNNDVNVSNAFNQMKTAGFNTLLGEQFNLLTKDDTINKRYLKLASTAGLKMFVIDTRINPRRTKTPTKKAQAYFTLYSHKQTDKSMKALAGFNLYDEPPLSDSAVISNWLSVYKQKFPLTPVYLNLLPSYAFGNHESYQKYFDYYIKKLYAKFSKPEIVSVDFYPFLKTQMRSDYFYNLQLLKETVRVGQTFWLYVLTTEHGPYAEQSFYNFCFSAFTAIMYGAKGLVYFTYETVPYETKDNYKEALIDLKGKPTIRYDYAQRINSFISRIAAPIVLSSKLKGVYHIAYPQNDKVSSSYVFSNLTPYVQSVSDTSMLISIFESKKKTKAKCLFVLNKSRHDANHVLIAFKSPYKAVSISDGIDKDDMNFGFTSLTASRKQLDLNLEPGELKVINFRK